MIALKQLFEENFVKESITEFARKLYILLEVITQIRKDSAYNECVCWETDDKTIVIKDTERLVRSVLPVIFKQKTLKSFIRQVPTRLIQLNMYNFRKAKNGKNPDYLYFRNTHFIRGNM